MKEIILHYLWLHKQVDVTRLWTTKGEKIEIFQFGNYLQTSGPDFFNAQMVIGDQKWAGNIEIHVKSSDWYLHHHQIDDNYNNVILHVVWEHDTEVYRKDNSEIPVLELQKVVDAELIHKIQNLLLDKKWINCENSIASVDAFVLENWKERLFFERLEERSQGINELFEIFQHDWEATFIAVLAKNFGLNANGENFLQILKAIPIAVLRKERHEQKHLEALFFGISGLLERDFEEQFPKELQEIWCYQQAKYQLEKFANVELQFYKLRPDNFPTIRLAQFAAFLSQNHSIFSLVNSISSFEEAKAKVQVSVSAYWNSHYNLDKTSRIKAKKMSEDFIELLVINAVIPLQYAYTNYLNQEKTEELIGFLQELKPERNTILERFAQLGVSNTNAFDSQALLQLKKKYCEPKQCLKCAIGIQLLKK